MKSNLLFVTLFIVNLSHANFGSCLTYAVIEDEDAYTNVRVDADSNSTIVYRLYENEVFQVLPNERNGWIEIRVWGDKYSLNYSCEDSKSSLTGFIHKSKIKYLDNESEYLGDGLILEYDIQPFNSLDKLIIQAEGNEPSYINGKKPLGVDGGIPATQLDGINLYVDGVRLSVPEIYFLDLFNCDNKFIIRKIKDTYFAYQSNSDGAGFYEIVWVININGIQQRLIQVYPC